jgi:hypothetical protein
MAGSVLNYWRSGFVQHLVAGKPRKFGCLLLTSYCTGKMTRWRSSFSGEQSVRHPMSDRDFFDVGFDLLESITKWLHRRGLITVWFNFYRGQV